MNFEKEVVSLEQMGFMLSLDAHCYVAPHSVGLEALEANLMGGTSISTEGLLDRIKERASKIFDKAKQYASRLFEFMGKHKVFSTVVLAAVAGFIAYALRGKPTPEDIRKKSKKLKDWAKKYDTDLISNYQGDDPEQLRLKQKMQDAEGEIRRKMRAEYRAALERKRAKFAKETVSGQKAEAEKGKIQRAITSVVESIKKLLSALPNMLRRGKAEEAEQKKEAPATEGFISDVGRHIREMVAHAVAKVVIITTSATVIIGSTVVAAKISRKLNKS